MCPTPILAKDISHNIHSYRTVCAWAKGSFTSWNVRFGPATALLAILFLFFAAAVPARATPFFARMYRLSCQSCHSGFPQLNSFGLAFKANGFRIPGAEKSAPMAWQKTVPIAVQVVPTLTRFEPGRVESDYTDTQVLAGGLLTNRTSFYLHHSYWIDGQPQEFPTYEVWAQHILDERSKLTLKAGQFELPYAYSPSINAVTEFQPLLFQVGAEGNDVLLGAPMRGLQLSGVVGRFQLSAASGVPSLQSSGNTIGEREFFGEFRDVFLRVATRNLTQTAGLFTYFTSPTRDSENPSTREHGVRYGADGRLLWRGTQYYATVLYGENSNPSGSGRGGKVRSMFVEADRMFLPWLGLTGRLDFQTVSVDSQENYMEAKTISLRLYPQQHLKIVAEYQLLDHHQSQTALAAYVTF